MSNAAEADSPAAALEARLRQVLGNEHVLTDLEDRQFFSSDVFREAEPAAFVIHGQPNLRAARGGRECADPVDDTGIVPGIVAGSAGHRGHRGHRGHSQNRGRV